MLKLTLPKLASAWELQRGEQFDFVEKANPDSSQRVAVMNQNKLRAATINNLDAERSVGSILYEMNVRSKKNLKAASSFHVKNNGEELTRGKDMPAEFRKLVKKDLKIDQILKTWDEKQKELVKEGLEEKEAANLSTDKRRNCDFEMLVKQGGPFTSPATMVEEFMARPGLSDVDKNKRLYTEVRDAEKSSMSFPKQ